MADDKPRTGTPGGNIISKLLEMVTQRVRERLFSATPKTHEQAAEDAEKNPVAIGPAVDLIKARKQKQRDQLKALED